MSTNSPSSGPPLSIVDLASLLFLGAVWGAAFLFYRIASPEVGPAWAAEISLPRWGRLAARRGNGFDRARLADVLPRPSTDDANRG